MFENHEHLAQDNKYCLNMCFVQEKNSIHKKLHTNLNPSKDPSKN